MLQVWYCESLTIAIQVQYLVMIKEKYITY